MNEMEKAAAGLLYGAKLRPATARPARGGQGQAVRVQAHAARRARAARGHPARAAGPRRRRLPDPAAVQRDYGYNIELAENFYANVSLVILDCAGVAIGDKVFIAPNVGIYTAVHPQNASASRLTAAPSRQTPGQPA